MLVLVEVAWLLLVTKVVAGAKLVGLNDPPLFRLLFLGGCLLLAPRSVVGVGTLPTGPTMPCPFVTGN